LTIQSHQTVIHGFGLKGARVSSRNPSTHFLFLAFSLSHTRRITRERRPAERWEEDDDAAVERLLGGALPTRTLTNPGAAVCFGRRQLSGPERNSCSPHNTLSSSDDHGESRARSGELRLKIYALGVWIHHNRWWWPQDLRIEVSPATVLLPLFNQNHLLLHALVKEMVSLEQEP
jgi:hypothetical protein